MRKKEEGREDVRTDGRILDQVAGAATEHERTGDGDPAAGDAAGRSVAESADVDVRKVSDEG